MTESDQDLAERHRRPRPIDIYRTAIIDRAIAPPPPSFRYAAMSTISLEALVAAMRGHATLRESRLRSLQEAIDGSIKRTIEHAVETAIDIATGRRL